MVRLIKEKENRDIFVRDLKDGEIAIIVDWGTNINRIGTIIQVHGKALVTLGATYENGFDDYKGFGDRCIVRILPKGSTLEV